jgi:hypothetical protein
MQTVIQAFCWEGDSLREKIVKDKKLEDYSLTVSKQKTTGRNPGWAKLYSTENDRPGVVNIAWHGAAMMLIARVVAKGGNKPDKLVGDFITYLLARHRDE